MAFFRRFLPIFAILTCAGCAQTPREVGVLRIAQEADPPTLDPARAYDTNCLPFVRVIYRGLVDYDEHANIINELAQSRSVSPDGKTYSFKLRPDVKFGDGTPVTAEDFRFAIERVLDPKTASDGQSFYTNIVGASEWTKDRGSKTPRLTHCAGIEVVGDVLRFHLLKNDVTFLNNLTLPFAYAIPRAYVQKLEKQFGGDANKVSIALSEAPNGCGPFRLGEWVHDGWLRLEKNPNYFRPELPKARVLSVKLGLSSSLQTMLFEQKQLDILPISDSFPSDFLRIKRDPRWQGLIRQAPMMDIRYLCMNNELAPFTDVRVRRALNYAINRDRIVEFLTGRATKARGPLPPGMPGYNPKLFQYSYDPAKARALLKEANYKDGAPIPLYYANDSGTWIANAAQSIQQDLKNVGMTVSLKPMRYSDVKAKGGTRGAKGAQLCMMGWLQDYPDPANFLNVLFSGENITPTTSINRAFFSDPKINEQLDAALRDTNRAHRLASYQTIEKEIVAAAPWVFLHHTERYMVTQKWVTGFRMHPMWSATYETVGTQ